MSVTASEVTTDIPFRAVITLRLGDVGRKVTLATLALHARADGTSACVPDGILAKQAELPIVKARRAVRWLAETGHIRQPDPMLPVYDIALTPDVRAEWRRSAPRREIPARHQPNGPYGSWIGNNPHAPGWAGSPTPAPGVYVVYVLFDDADVPCYVGYSDSFRARIQAHANEKPFATWQAVEAYGLTQALGLETRTIARLKPYLNVAKVTR